MATSFTLPAFGQDWITGCEGLYILISLKYSDENITMYWRHGGYGYSDSLAGAGKFNEDSIRDMFEGTDLIEIALPVPCTRDAFALLGLYPVIANYQYLPQFVPKEIAHHPHQE